MTASTEAPYPPLTLASRVCCLENRGEPLAAYDKLGAEVKAALMQMLPAGWSLEDKRVLDC
jgi:hypothetical protein